MVQRVVYQEFQANRGYFDTQKKRKEKRILETRSEASTSVTF